jgi:hypothetical protein
MSVAGGAQRGGEVPHVEMRDFSTGSQDHPDECPVHARPAHKRERSRRRVRNPPPHPARARGRGARGRGASEFAQKSLAGAASNTLIVLAKLRICP